jgi:uncharacterized protein (DUF4415 family)
MNKSTTGNIIHSDLARLMAMSDEDIAYDEDNPITTEADWEGAVMKIGDKVIGVVRGRGKQKKPTKIPTTLRLSPEVMAYFKSTGEGWQTRVDAALREYIQAHPVK